MKNEMECDDRFFFNYVSTLSIVVGGTCLPKNTFNVSFVDSGKNVCFNTFSIANIHPSVFQIGLYFLSSLCNFPPINFIKLS